MGAEKKRILCGIWRISWYSSKKEKERLFCIVYSLHQGKRFQIALVGSVILFIRKNDLIKIIVDAHRLTNHKPRAVEKTVSSLLQL